MKIDGACHRGYITYIAEIDPEKDGIRHCTDCQSRSGSAFRISVPASKEAIHRTAGDRRSALRPPKAAPTRSGVLPGVRHIDPFGSRRPIRRSLISEWARRASEPR